jgi:glycosyltransferase involved in cell wall biosynthesis
MPITILEAMASKVPIAATDVLGINELITSEENGILAESDNSVALADAIMSLLGNTDLASRMTENAFTYVKERHSMEAWLQSYEDLFLDRHDR